MPAIRAKTERNNAILRDRQRGDLLKVIAARYGISIVRVNQIIRRQARMTDHPPRPAEGWRERMGLAAKSRGGK